MAKEFKLQDPGEGIHEAEVREVSVSSGDKVKEGDPLLAVETDKAVNEIDSPFTGTIASVEVETGQQISVGDVLLTYEADGDNGGEKAPPKGKKGASEKDGKRKSKEKTDAASDEDVSREGAEEVEEAKAAADTQKESEAEDAEQSPEEETEEEMEEQEKEEEREEETEGKDAEAKEKKQARKSGATAEKDENRPEIKKAEKESQEGKGGKPDRKRESGRKAEKSRPVPAAPATRRLARERGIDLRQVEGSGPGGRVTAEDLRTHGGAAKQGPEREAAELPDFSQWGKVERKPFRSVRRATAKQMSLAWEKIPHVMHREMADVTELEQFRRQNKGAIADRGGKLTLTVLLMKALAAGLREYPDFNASLDEENGEIIVKHYHHIGVAVSTDQGLLVPVVRDVDRKSVTELAVELTELAERARQGKIKREEMRGGSFTITNPGPIGGDSFTPIINYPQAAILGVGSARLEPVITGDMENYQLAPRLRVPLCLVYDHRLNDGASAARFLHRIVDILHDPQSFLLTV